MPVRDATGALVRAITRAFAPNHVNFVNLHSRDWVSGTLAATRHRICLQIAGEDAWATADAFAKDLGEREFDLGRFILADIAIASELRDEDGARLTLEALTIDGE